jgi:hypothetical protein
MMFPLILTEGWFKTLADGQVIIRPSHWFSTYFYLLSTFYTIFYDTLCFPDIIGGSCTFSDKGGCLESNKGPLMILTY